MNLNKQALDNWIMGVNDPNAPFNQPDYEVCPNCDKEDPDEEFEYNEEENSLVCNKCGHKYFI